MKFFNRFAKPGKGVTKEEAGNRFGFRHFFSLLRDQFWQIVLLNLLFFLVNIFVLGLLAYLANVGGHPFQAPVNPLYGPMRGVWMHGAGEMPGALYGLFGTEVESFYPSAITYVLLGAGILTVFTFGIGFAAMTVVQRDFVRGEPTDTFSDFFYSIKKNWLQALFVGLIDLTIMIVIAFDITSYLYSNSSFGFRILFYATIFLSILYFFMRPYLYLQITTFRIGIFKAIKNSYILALAGIRRNLLCGAVAGFLFLLNYVTFVFLPSIGVILVFMFTVSMAWFLQIFAAWPVVKKHMIDPYYKEETPAPTSEEETVFKDRG